MKNVLIIATSPRKNGNCEILADEFLRGARDCGNNVEKVVLYDKNIKFCVGCFACQKTNECIIKNDDANIIAKKMLNADVILFATPVYFYSMCGQMKALLDRSNQLYLSAYKFRDVYLIATAADSAKDCFDGTIMGIQGWVQCFEKANLRGIITAPLVHAVGDIKKYPNKTKKAYEMGKKV